MCRTPRPIAPKREFLEATYECLAANLKEPDRPRGRRIPAEGDLAVGEWRGHATSIVDRPYDNEYCRVIRVAEDQIGEVRAYLDDALGEELFRTTQRKQEHLSTGEENVTDTSNQPPTIDDGQLNGKFETGRRTSFPPHSSDSTGGP